MKAEKKTLQQFIDSLHPAPAPPGMLIVNGMVGQVRASFPFYQDNIKHIVKAWEHFNERKLNED